MHNKILEKLKIKIIVANLEIVFIESRLDAYSNDLGQQGQRKTTMFVSKARETLEVVLTSDMENKKKKKR